MAIKNISADHLSRNARAIGDGRRRTDDVAAAPQTRSSATTASPAELQAAVKQLQEAVDLGPNPNFRLDYLSGLSVVTVRSNVTGEVVFQLPDARALELARLLKDGSSLASLGLIDFKV